MARICNWGLLATATVVVFAGPAWAQSSISAPHRPAGDCARTPDDSTCRAGTGSAPGGFTYLTPLVVSAGEAAGGVGDPYATPKAVSTIGSEEINQFGGENLDDAIRATPGTFTHDNPQNPGIAVNIRGMDSYGRVTSEIDGARQSFRFTGHDAAGMTYIDPALLEGIDITRGSVDGPGGAGALAGAANFKTLEVDDLITGDKPYGGFTQITAGTNGDGVSEATVAAYRLNENFAVLGGISKRNQQDYQNGAGETVENTGQDVLSGMVKAEITPNADTRLTVAGIVYNDKFAANGYQQTVTNQTYSARLDYTPAGNDLIDLHANVYYNDTRMNYTGREPGDPYYDPLYLGPTYGYVDFLPDVGRVIDDKGSGVTVTNTSRGQAGNAGLKSTYGLEFNHDHADVTEPSDVPGINPTGTADLLSVFDSTTASVGMIDVTGGLRWTGYNASGTVPASQANINPDFSGASSLSAQSLDPSLTIALNATDAFQPYITYSHTFRPPTVSELYAGGEHPGGFVLFGADPYLVPETANNFEIGANFRKDAVLTPDDSLRIKADVFRSYVDNYIAGAYTGYDPDTYAPYWNFVNVAGTSTIEGFELQAAYDAGGYFGSLAYTHTHSELPQTNVSSVSYTPDDVVTATAGVRLLEEHKLTLGGRLNIVSQTKLGPDDEGGAQAPIPGYNTVDLFANYKFGNGVELGANVSNVFNVSYTPSLSTTPDLDPAGGTGRGRTFEATLKASF